MDEIPMGFVMRTALSDKDLEAPRLLRTAVGEEKKFEDPDKQKLTEQIVKYVPLEVVGFYVPALAGLATLKTLYTNDPPIVYSILQWIIFLLAFGGTFYYIHKKAVEELGKKSITSKNARALMKAGISSVAFIIWAITLGGPWSFLVHFEAIGVLLIPTFTFLSPIIYDLTIGLVIAKPAAPPLPAPLPPIA